MKNKFQKAFTKTSIIVAVFIIIAIISISRTNKSEETIKPKEIAGIIDAVNIETEENNEKQTVEVEEEPSEESLVVPVVAEEIEDIVEESQYQEEKAVNNVQEETGNIQNQTQYYKVVKVVDGDTIAVDINGVKETIRLIGINTPETVDPRKPVECFGKEASNKAKELLSGQWVELESDPTQDDRGKYDRLLRYVKTKDGMFYNLEIIKQGYAYEYTYNVPYKYQTEFKQAEDYARNNKIGLWADGICDESIPDVVVEQEPEAQLELQQTECECSSNLYNCSDFTTHDEAQLLFECCGGINNDIHRLDRDKDGMVCESLP